MAKKISSKISNPQSLRVLMVEDSEDDALLIIRELKKGGYNPVCERVETAAAMKKALKDKQWDIILCDYKLPKFSGEQAIALLKETNIEIPLIIVSGTIGEETAVECMRSGAHDYIMKNNLSRLCPAIARELEEGEIRVRRKRAEESLKESAEKYQRFFMTSRDCVFITSKEGSWIDMNDAAVELFSYSSREELMQVKITNLYVNPEERTKHNSIIAERGYSKEYPVELRRKDGTVMHTLITSVALCDAEKNVIGFQGTIRDITERKRVDEQLKQQADAMNVAIEGIAILDEKGEYVYLNKAHANIYGYDNAEELIGKPWSILYDSGELQRFEQKIMPELLQKENWQGEAIGKKTDGRKFPQELSLTTLDSGGLICVVRDITERKRAEDALKNSEEKYRTILENIEDGYYEVVLNGNLTFFNDSMCQIWGYPKEELMGMNYREYTDAENAKKLFQSFNEVYRTGEPAKEFDWQIIRKDGTKRFIEASISLLKDSSDKPTGFRGIIRDITERKKMEEVLRQSEERYRTILEQMNDGYFEVDLVGNYTFVNEINSRLLGYSPDELIGQSYRIQVSKENAEILYNAFSNIYKTGKPERNIFYEAIHKDGTTGFAELTAFPLLNKKGDIIGFRGIARDITESKLAEEALRESEGKYRLTFASTSDVIFNLDAELNVSSITPSVEKILGYKVEELINKPFQNLKIMTPESLMKAISYALTLLSGEDVPITIYEFIAKDGAIIFGEVISSPIINENKVIGITSAARDITQRIRAEEKFIQSEEKYHNILESIDEGYYEVDLVGNLTFINDSMCRIMGYPQEELLSMNYRGYADKVNAKKLFQAFNEVYRTGKPGKIVDYEIIRKDGTNRYIETSVTLYKDSSGKPIGFRGIIRDVSEQKQAEKELLKSEEKYRSLVENAQEGIFQSTAEGHHITVNQAFANILGYESTEEVMATIADIPHQVYVHPDDRTKILQIIEKEGSVKGYEAEFYKKDGSKTWVSINMHAVRDEEGRLLYYQGINQDIIEKKNMERERQENIERLRKSLGATINAMAVTVETRDPYTAGHQRRVADLARAIAVEMNLKSEQIDSIRMASMIHDIGKISIPSEILSKPTKLTDLEFDLIKTHSQSGYNILKDIEFPWPVADVVLQHHERMNGSGYPQGLKGDDILLEARILAIADVVEAIASHRPYRPALGIDLAMEEISGNKGILYDADAVDACLKLFREKGYNLVLKKL